MFVSLVISLLALVATSSYLWDGGKQDDTMSIGLRRRRLSGINPVDRPIIYTFYDGDASHQTEEQVLLKIWKDEWQNAGWVPRLLTLEDARQHKHFQTLNSMLEQSGKMKKTDYLMFMKWLAMANQPKGGFFTKYDTFPLAWTYHGTMPNGGRLTSFETAGGDNSNIPSLLSASQYEWFRFAWSLVENASRQDSADRRFDQIIKDIYSQSEDTFQIVEDGVLPSLKVLDGKGYSEVTCDAASRAYAIRFSQQDIEKGVLPTGAKGISSTAEEWLAGWRKNCEVHSAASPLSSNKVFQSSTSSKAKGNDAKAENVVQPSLSTSRKPNSNDTKRKNSTEVEIKDSAKTKQQSENNETIIMKHAEEERADKPVIFTFYEDIDSFELTGMRSDDDEQLIQEWARAWQEMGWEPRVLDFSIARKHPEFQIFDQYIKELPFHSFDRIGFYKYLAAGMAGGGWLSDFDTFPLLRSRWSGKGNPTFLPNKGNLTVYELTSDGAMPVPSLMSGTAEEWFRLAKNQVANAREHNAATKWNDMKAIQDMQKKSKGTLVKVEDAVVPGDALLKKMNVESDDCEGLRNKLAIHFSHFSLDQTGRWKTGAEGAKHRADLSRKWTKNYFKACGGV